MVELPCTAPGCNYQGTGAPYKTPEMAASSTRTPTTPLEDRVGRHGRRAPRQNV